MFDHDIKITEDRSPTWQAFLFVAYDTQKYLSYSRFLAKILAIQDPIQINLKPAGKPLFQHDRFYEVALRARGVKDLPRF